MQYLRMEHSGSGEPALNNEDGDWATRGAKEKWSSTPPDQAARTSVSRIGGWGGHLEARSRPIITAEWA